MKTNRTTVVLILLLLVGVVAVHGADVQTITHGREVEIETHLVPGKYVLFDFYADWCGPCRALEPRLLDLAGRHDDQLALRKVDIINWDSPVARQYSLSSIPYMMLYGPDGARLAAGDAGSVIRRLESSLGGGSFTPSNGGGSSIVPLLAVAVVFAFAVGLIARKRRPPRPMQSTAEGTVSPAMTDTTADPGDPAIWFILLQGSLDGPFTRRQLGELVRRGALSKTSNVRRRGDATWTTIDDVLD